MADQSPTSGAPPEGSHSPSAGPERRDRRRPAGVVERNIRALVRQRAEEEREQPLQERIARAVTRFAGSMRFVYVHLAVVLAWFAINLGWIPGVRPFDPSFVILAMITSVEALFLSAFVLITQNRMSEAAAVRADLDLQISLLAEHEITRLLRLTTAIGSRIGVAEAQDPELQELGRDVAPEEVLRELEVHNEAEDAAPARSSRAANGWS